LNFSIKMLKDRGVYYLERSRSCFGKIIEEFFCGNWYKYRGV
jgi:hypothetical protein